jgi:D-amino-acid oxidase
MHAPNYLRHLAATLRSSGVKIHRQRLTSLEEAYNLPEFGSVDLVINATGLGARVLLGNEDKMDIYPIRGQTVLVKAPNVKTCYMKASDHPDESTTKDTKIPEPTYIIPRPGPEGHVVL